MNLQSIFFSPLTLIFFIIVFGFALGKIRICRVSLGIAGVLFSAILIGFMTNHIITATASRTYSDIQTTMNILSKFGSSLFISAIGIQTGLSAKSRSRESAISLIIGALMSISATLSMLLIHIADKTISYSSLLGTLCGAITSSPGLSCVCDMTAVTTAEAVLAYGASYPTAVVSAVVFARFFTRKQESGNVKVQQLQAGGSQFSWEFFHVSVVSLIGNILSDIRIASFKLPLGNTVCTLFVGLIIGIAMRLKGTLAGITPERFCIYKNIGLVLFFVGTGFSSGSTLVSVQYKSVIYGAIITLSAVLCGWLSCRIFSRRFTGNAGLVIAGGLTSSPAYGAICRNAYKSAGAESDFTFSYFGALLTLIFALQIIGR